jgi:hypothetical protein
MSKLFLVVATAAAAAVFAIGCSCSEVGCDIGADQGVKVTLKDALITYAPSFPATFHLCAGSACADFVVQKKDGAIVCDDGQGEGESDTQACFPMNDKDLELVLVTDMPNDTSDVSMTIKDANGTVLFDDSTNVPVAAYEPNGSMCAPSCRTAEASFTTGPSSQ